MSPASPSPSRTVTVMIPVYNRRDLVEACLESAVAQTYPHVDIVVVDGASTDGTWEVCQDFAASNPAVRAVREETNSGPVAGWRRCLDEATGRYGVFLWSDDLIEPQFVAAMLQLLEDDVAFAFSAARVGETPGVGPVHYVHPTGRIEAETFMHAAITGSDNFPVSPACAVFRLEDMRRSFTSVLPTDPPLDMASTGAGTDLLLFLNTAARYRYVAADSRTLAFFRTHAGSITVQDTDGLVARSYLLARAWFAKQRGSESLASELIARQWIGALKSEHKLLSPSAAARESRGLVTSGQLLRAAAHLVARKLRLRPAALASPEGSRAT